MNKQHAPGPWYARPSAGNDIHGQSIVASESTGKSIAVVYDGNADAQLIATAPDMLAALRDVVEELKHAAHIVNLDEDAIGRAKTAIAKAEGRSHE